VCCMDNWACNCHILIPGKTLGAQSRHRTAEVLFSRVVSDGLQAQQDGVQEA
jgi:hypothetical protein